MPKTTKTKCHQRLIKFLIDTRRRLGMRQAEVAKRLGHSQTWIARVESGDRRVDVCEFILFAKLFEVEPTKALSKITRGL